MRALHLPGAADGHVPAFNYPNKKGRAEALQFSKDIPKPIVPAGCSTNAYILRVQTTALQKGELTWPEPLERHRFQPWAGAIPGHDVVGTIDTVHHATTAPSPKFKAGDRVWGLIDFDRDGAAADYVLAYENEIALAPQSIQHLHRTSSATLATVPLSGLTAYQALYTNGHFAEPSTTTTAQRHSRPPAQEPKRLLITGASGTLLDAHPLPKGHPSRDVVLDYTTSDFHLSTALRNAGITEPFDLVIEAAGGEIAADIILQDGIVKVPGGRVMSISGPLEGGLATLDEEMAAQVKAKLAVEDREGLHFEFFIVKPDMGQLERLGEWVKEGMLMGEVESVWELEHGRGAMMRVEQGKGRKGRGKVVLRVDREQ
ncbi:uncharacterized protein AB675_12175 [Cyphellophora attinorum]|uniref:Uncharacterized protein n=1 Tax=Cyphellophora attinorum TaxID=1664694 RepID=A0A0N0NKU5_9EURO|nr:uncharacterized protein AB675_12175 [Phialophora attinorum]KPI38438.1 hypothetical protein AB675_12175 [Phialophora attinorum]